MDISTAATDAQDMSVVVLDNSKTVTPTATANPYFPSTHRSSKQQTPLQGTEGAEETTEELETPQRPGRVKETKVEMEPMKIPGPQTPTATHWKHFTRLDVILQVSPVGDSNGIVQSSKRDVTRGVQ